MDARREMLLEQGDQPKDDFSYRQAMLAQQMFDQELEAAKETPPDKFDFGLG